MKILFVIRHTGYLRHYEPVIECLARRGHQVHMGFNAMRRKAHLGKEQIERLCRECPGVTTSVMPDRWGLWRPLLYYVRGLRDYLRFLHPRYDRAPKLRERAVTHVGKVATWLVSLFPGIKTVTGQDRLTRILRKVENAIPSSRVVERSLREHNPDVILVTPLVDFGSKQLDHLKAARAAHVRSGLCVASWDNLTNKGIIQLAPDAVLVWNGDQKQEAMELHGIPEERIRVTGAQSFDKWFDRQPVATREQFCLKLGLDPRQPIILYVCSSGFIAREEAKFVEKWLRTVRGVGDTALSKANVLIRPHPLNADQWADTNWPELEPLAIYPRGGAYVTTDDSKAAYFDSIYHSTAVVGINTSALIEAGIIGRVSHTIITDDFADTQEGTLHFDYLVRDGYLKAARDLREHAQQLRETLDNGQDGSNHVRPFILSFIRPQGLDKPSTPLVADHIEAIAKCPASTESLEAYSPAITWLILAPIAFVGLVAEFGYRACRKSLLLTGIFLQKRFLGRVTIGRSEKAEIKIRTEEGDAQKPVVKEPPLRKSA